MSSNRGFFHFILQQYWCMKCIYFFRGALYIMKEILKNMLKCDNCMSVYTFDLIVRLAWALKNASQCDIEVQCVFWGQGKL